MLGQRAPEVYDHHLGHIRRPPFFLRHRSQPYDIYGVERLTDSLLLLGVDGKCVKEPVMERQSWVAEVYTVPKGLAAVERR